MKVTFVIQKLAGLKGGAERVLCDISNALAARGETVEILTYERRSAPPGYDLGNVKVSNLFPFQKPAIPNQSSHARYRAEGAIKKIPNFAPLPQLKWAMTYRPFITVVTRHLAQRRPDVVVGFLPAGIIAASQAGNRLSLPCIASTHNVPEQDFGQGERWDTNPIFRFERVKALETADMVTVLQTHFIQHLPKVAREKARVMPNPVLQGVAPKIQRANRDKLVVGVGRLTKVKRFDRLIETWAKLDSRFPEWRVEIYGDGPERKRLDALINGYGLAGRIRVMGVVHDIAEVYEKSAILCHPAEFEGFGLSVAEALSHGVPVIADAKCPGVNALVRDGISGILVDQQAPTGWTNALSTLIKNQQLRSEYGKAGHRDMKAFSPNKVVEAWTDCLREVAESE